MPLRVGKFGGKNEADYSETLNGDYHGHIVKLQVDDPKNPGKPWKTKSGEEKVAIVIQLNENARRVWDSYLMGPANRWRFKAVMKNLLGLDDDDPRFGDPLSDEEVDFVLEDDELDHLKQLPVEFTVTTVDGTQGGKFENVSNLREEGQPKYADDDRPRGETSEYSWT